jgi:hypothetical protein
MLLLPAGKLIFLLLVGSTPVWDAVTSSAVRFRALLCLGLGLYTFQPLGSQGTRQALAD